MTLLGLVLIVSGIVLIWGCTLKFVAMNKTAKIILHGITAVILLIVIGSYVGVTVFGLTAPYVIPE